MDNWNNNIVSNRDKRLLTKTVLLSFKLASWQLRQKKGNIRFSNLSLYALLVLHNNKPLLRAEIMNALKSNYHDVDAAIQLLRLNGLLTNEYVYETRINNSMTVRSKRYRLTLNGAIFVDEFLENLTRA